MTSFPCSRFIKDFPMFMSLNITNFYNQNLVIFKLKLKYYKNGIQVSIFIQNNAYTIFNKIIRLFIY